jgi:Ca-activated chloride channel family protein
MGFKIAEEMMPQGTGIPVPDEGGRPGYTIGGRLTGHGVARTTAWRRVVHALLFGIGFLLVADSLLALPSTRSLIRDGNRAYEKDDYVGAEVQYRKALEKDGDLPEGNYDLGGALYKQGKFDASKQALDDALAGAKDDRVKANAYFNRGNALFNRKRYKQSIDSYVRSLQIDPNDLDAKYNLLSAMRALKEQEQQKQEKQDGQKGDSQEKQSQHQQGDKQEQSQKQEQQSGKQEENKQGGDARSQKPKEGDMSPQSQENVAPNQGEEKQMSRAEADRILQALKENEIEVQKKLMAKPGGRVKVEKDW